MGTADPIRGHRLIAILLRTWLTCADLDGNVNLPWIIFSNATTTQNKCSSGFIATVDRYYLTAMQIAVASPHL